MSADPSKMRVTVNGIDAPVLSMASNRLDVQAPWEISGAKALVRVTGPDGGYADTLVEIQSVVPALGGGLGILRPSGDFDMNPAAFAAGNVVVFLAEGLGRVEPPPKTGMAPERASLVTAEVTASVAGLPATIYPAMLAADRPGQYYVVLGIPPGVPAGGQPVRLAVNGIATERTFTFR